MKHKRYFPTMSAAQCEALARLCRLKPSGANVLHMYAVEAAEPARIAESAGVAMSNVNRTLKLARDCLKDALLVSEAK